jgi:hypothetical protein
MIAPMAIQNLSSASLYQSAPMAQNFFSFCLPVEKLCGVIRNLTTKFRNRIRFGTRQEAGQRKILCLAIWSLDSDNEEWDEERFKLALEEDP